MHMGLSLSLTSQGGGATATTSVPVVITFGQSNSTGARNVVTEITGHPGLATSARVKIWDTPSQTILTLVPGVMEQQPGLAFIDPAYTNTVGWKGEFDRFWLRDNPTGTIYHFGYSVGGSRFSSAGSLGADANWLPGISGGAREKMLIEWNAFVAALLADNKVPNVVYGMSDLGLSSATDAGEIATYQTDMTALIAWMRANIGTSTTRLTLSRAPASISGITAPNLATLRTAQAAIATADAYTDIMNMDDAHYAPGAADGIHFSAAQHMLQGERLACRYANRWHPMDALVDGSSIYPTNSYRPGDWRNTIVTGVSSNWDGIRGALSAIAMTQATTTRQPLIVTENTADGLSIRIADYDGTDDRLARTTGIVGALTAWGLIVAARVTTPGAEVTVVGEGLSTDASPFISLRINAAGRAEFLCRNDLDVTTGPVDLNAQTAGGNVMRHLALAAEVAGVTGMVNGVTGSRIDYTGGAFGTATTNRVLTGAVQVSSTVAQFADCALAEVWWTNTTPDATYLANAHAWNQWRWGAAA